jgi:hypothetical protein
LGLYDLRWSLDIATHDWHFSDRLTALFSPLREP